MTKLKLILVGIILLATVGVALAASQYSIGRSVVATGGGERASSGYVVHDVTGEAAVGISRSASYVLRAGFLPFTPGECTPGDANGDGNVDAQDVITCKQIILGLESETCGADANADTVVDGRDVIRIKKMVLGIAP